MSYIQKSLGPNEKLLYTANIHWIIYVRPIVFLMIGLSLVAVAAVGPQVFSDVDSDAFNIAWFVSLVVMLFGIIGLIGAFILNKTTDLAVTDKKVLAKVGLISRHTIEQRLATIDSVQVRQGILGRIFNFGSISVSGSGASNTPIDNIADPIGFRRAVEAAENSARGES